jgi:hypothetical protein
MPDTATSVVRNTVFVTSKEVNDVVLTLSIRASQVVNCCADDTGAASRLERPGRFEWMALSVVVVKDSCLQYR